MRNFISAGLFLLTVSTTLAADYDEILARYKLWPMASASHGTNPNLCVKDNFADSKVGNYWLHSFKIKFIVCKSIYRPM